jgi:hypothetical protein
MVRLTCHSIRIGENKGADPDDTVVKQNIFAKIFWAWPFGVVSDFSKNGMVKAEMLHHACGIEHQSLQTRVIRRSLDAEKALVKVWIGTAYSSN